MNYFLRNFLLLCTLSLEPFLALQIESQFNSDKSEIIAIESGFLEFISLEIPEEDSY